MSAYKISSLWCYPVKSMAGEQLETVNVTARGLSGDRAYALVDTSNKKVGSAKSVRKSGELLKCRAEFVTPPVPDGPVPAVRITLPDSSVVESEQPDAATILSAAFGLPITLVSTAATGLMLEFPAGTLGGKYAETTEFPVAGAAPPGTLFDYACIHILTNSSLQRLQEAYPEGQFVIQRFRPNIVIDCAGVYADIIKTGSIRCGDPVRVTE